MYTIKGIHSNPLSIDATSVGKKYSGKPNYSKNNQKRKIMIPARNMKINNKINKNEHWAQYIRTGNDRIVNVWYPSI